MKEHEKRELVDALTRTARTYIESDQLRDRIADVVLPALDSLERYWAHEAGAVVAGVVQRLSPPPPDFDKWAAGYFSWDDRKPTNDEAQIARDAYAAGQQNERQKKYRPSVILAYKEHTDPIDWGEVDGELLNYLEGITRAATMERGQERDELELRNVGHIRALLRKVSGQ